MRTLQVYLIIRPCFQKYPLLGKEIEVLHQNQVKVELEALFSLDSERGNPVETIVSFEYRLFLFATTYVEQKHMMSTGEFI